MAFAVDSYTAESAKHKLPIVDAAAPMWLNRRKEIARILDTLTDRERDVLSFRFGLADGFSRTLLTVGEQFGIDRDRIRLIEAKALRKLRSPDR